MTLRHRSAGFTLVELSMYMLLSTILALGCYSYFRSIGMLTNKNAALNRSHDDLRMSFDRMAHILSKANNIPTLLTATGATTATGPAAGLKFDEVIGDPYVLDPPTTAGSIASTATTITLWRTTNPLAGVNNPAPNAAIGSTVDITNLSMVLLIPLPNGTNLKKKITKINSSAVTNSADLSAGKQQMTLTLDSALGTPLSWNANEPQLVKIVRTEAFLVVPNPNTGRNELRLYKSFEPVPTDLLDKNSSVVLCDQIGTATGEGTPFEIVDYNGGDKIVKSTLRVKERAGSGGFMADEENNYNSYFQLHINLPSRLRPRNTN